MIPNWKLDRIKSLDDEVKELHPVLHELFRNMPNISSVIYSQGSRENGADFVLCKRDDVLEDEDYVGVIVKSTPIKQNHDDVNRQIRECELPRPAASGTKEIIISEIWVVTSKNVTRSAQDHIFHEYRSKKVKFFDAEKIVGLIDKFYPGYWEFSSFKLNKFIASQREIISKREGQHSLLPKIVQGLEFQCQIAKEVKEGRRKFRKRQERPTSLVGEILKNRFLFIEGGMGSGKSELLRKTVKDLCSQDSIENLSLIPYLTTYRDLRDSNLDFDVFVNGLEEQVDDETKELVVFVDGFDETSESPEVKTDYICKLARSISARVKTKLVVASRPVLEEKCVEELDRHYDRYSICALSYATIIGIIERICNGQKVSNKFRSDLQSSHLMQALPKTPMSAILLGRLLSENVKELPSTLPELYSKYTDLVLGRWDIQKGAGSEKEYETIQRITGYVAAYMLEHDLEFLGVNELNGIFKDYLSVRRTGQNIDALMVAFLNRREIIGVSDDGNSMFFKHKTFKEFFYATMQLQQKGVEAPIVKPFDLYWQGAEYFYLGLVKDAPKRITELSRLLPGNDLEVLIKASTMGDFMLAAYQTPYQEITTSVEHIFKDMASLYVDLVYNKKESWLRKLPEMQLLCMFTMALRENYGYEFFQPALHESKIQADLDANLSTEQRNVLMFFLDSVLAALGDESAFLTLGTEYESSLDWVLRMGINHAANDVGLVNAVTKKIGKRVNKAMKGNTGFKNYILEVEGKPLDERKQVSY